MSRKPTQIQLAGPFTIVSGGHRVPDVELGSRKGRSLLKVLVINRGHIVSTDRIVEALWGESTPAHVDENIAALVSRLRSVLAKEIIQGGKGGYMFRTDGACRVDLDDAEDLVANARRHLGRRDRAAAATAAEAGLAILDRGELLEDEPYAEWVASARVATRRLHRAARELAWAAALSQGDHARALALAEAAIASDNLDEEAHRVRMLALYRGGEASRALVAYEDLRALVSDELGADPSPESQALHRAILRGEVETLQEPLSTAGADIGLAVGRDDELLSLHGAWAAAQDSGPGLALLVGEAGSGKSHLASALAAELGRSGALVLTTTCYEMETSLFLEPVLDALRPAILGSEGVLPVAELAVRVRATLVGLMPDIAPVVGEEASERISSEEERARAIDAVVAVLAALARRRRVLLCIDDLHNAGQSTLEFIHVFVRRGRAMPVMILGTVRDERLDEIEGMMRLATRVDVGPLAPEAIAMLAQNAGLAEVPENLAAITGGNALYVIEALRAMRDSTRADIPASLRKAIRNRVDRAGDEFGRFLRAASVVGPSFDLPVVEALLETQGSARVARLGEEALRRKLLVESGIQYQFAHELVRETLYESIPGPTRAAWHGRIAAIKQGRGEPSQVVGYHADRAGDFALACQSYLAAADRAARSFSNAEAEEMLSQALAAANELDDSSRRAEILVRRGAVRIIRGLHDLAESDLVEALELARLANDGAMEARAEEQRGWNAYLRRDLATASDRVADATAVEGHGLGTELLAARVYHAMGKLDLAQAAAQSALAAAEQNGDRADEARALSYLGSLDCHLDAYRQAIDRTTRAEALGRRAALFHPTLNGVFFRAMALGNRGDLGEALASFERLRREGKAGDTDHYEARSLNGAAWMWLEMGDASRATDLAAEAVAAAAAPTMEEPRANALYQLARAAWVRGDPDRAAAILEEGRQLGEAAAFGWRYELRALDLQACILASQGEKTTAVATKLLDLALGGRAPKFVALALAHMGRRAAAGQIAERLGSDLLTARVGLESGARRAVERLAARLDPCLRSAFLAAVPGPAMGTRDREHPNDPAVVLATTKLIASSMTKDGP